MRKRVRRVLAGMAALLLFAATAFSAASDAEFFSLCATGTTKVLDAAIRAGADVNAKARDGLSPLMFAARYNRDPKVIALLVGAGAQVNAQDKSGNTPLMWAAYLTPIPAVLFALIDAGADVNAKNKYNATALMWAAGYNSNPEAVDALLRAGADAATKDVHGKRAADYIRENAKLKDSPVAGRLNEAGAGTYSGDFLQLCKLGTLREIQAAIRAGADVNARDTTGGTALMQAAFFNSDPAVITTLVGA